MSPAARPHHRHDVVAAESLVLMARIVRALDTRPAHAAVPGAIAVIIALTATQFHRNGHMLGDDFALYLRQAQSLFEGNPAEAVADNRFMVVNSPNGISPMAYPWGWPLVLSPFVQWWGLDFARLKLIEVGLLAIALVLLHGIVRRRTNRWIATAVMLAVGLSPVFLAHTDQLLSEYPHLVTTLLVIWWMDRMIQAAPDVRLPWLTAHGRDLVVVGLLAAFAFNMRREGLVLFAVIAAAQAVDVVRLRWPPRHDASPSDEPPPGVVPRGLGAIARRLAIPHAAFAGAIVGFQLLLPSTLIPDTGGSPRHIAERFGDSLAVFAHHLGLGADALTNRTQEGVVSAVGVLVFVLAMLGAAAACHRDPRRNVPLVALVATTMLTIGTHFRLVDRYYLQVTPFILFFATYAIYAAANALADSIGNVSTSDTHDTPGTDDTRGTDDTSGTDDTRGTDDTSGTEGNRRSRVARHVATALACIPLVGIAVAHVPDVRDRIDTVRTFNDAGRVQWGPAHRDFAPVFTAVRTHTSPTSVIAFQRARTMTLYTDRRTVQPGTLETIAVRADYFAMQKNSTYSQPLLTDAEAQAAGLTKVWEDRTWVLWRFPEPGEQPGASGQPGRSQ